MRLMNPTDRIGPVICGSAHECEVNSLVLIRVLFQRELSHALPKTNFAVCASYP